MPKSRRTIRLNGGRKRYSHYVWHAHTGHWPTSPDEVIHHIDGNPLNDEFNNLQLMSNSEHSSQHNIGENNPNFGISPSEESNAKRSATLIDHPVSEETKAKMSAAKMGDRNPSWKGDAATPQSKSTRIWRARKKEQTMKSMVKREHHSMPSDEYPLQPSSPTPCPPDCPAKRFCDPSSCALESVREANAIAARLRRAA